jgi:hypothetical protein
MLDHGYSAAAALGPLKAFQRRTVDHAFARLFTDSDRTRQFLVADEVGLGKTMVARGVIARTIELLQGSVQRIDIVYVCSNGAIAQQNLARLNVVGDGAQSLPTRLTLLPLQLGGDRGLRRNRVNFISLTPGTTFDLKSSTGTARERALILRILSGLIHPAEGAHRLFQVTSRDPGWKAARAEVDGQEIDETIAAGFRDRVIAEPGLPDELSAMAEGWAADPAPDVPMQQRRDRAIARLRGLLARECVAALQPDLVILDEIQRFHDLLHGQSKAAELARHLFDYVDSDGNETRTLLLSATPYRMLTLAEDAPEEGEHHKDFLEVMRFLFGRNEGQRRAEELGAEMRRFRRAILALPDSFDEARATRQGIEARLSRVIARTERVAETAERDAMVREVADPVELRPDDLREARAIAEVAAAAGAPGTLEYWKSAPYLLSFMRGYKLRNRLDEQDRAPSPRLRAAIRAARPFQLDRAAVDAYRPIAPNNGRMRALAETAFDGDMARRLWVPPSLPYFGSRIGASKALVFSSWSMVPDAIAALLSHEAERRMGMGGDGHGYFDYQSISRPIQFREVQGRLAGLRALLLVCPSPTLAAAADPLAIVRADGAPPDHAGQRSAVMQRLEPLARALAAAQEPGEREVTWDWVGPAWLDQRRVPAITAWMNGELRLQGNEEAWGAHIGQLATTAAADRLSGSADEGEILGHLADVALGSPATCALRALSRVVPSLPLDAPAMLSAAASIGMGFRTLFNQPESKALLRGADDEHYWHAVLRFCAENDLQAVLDEYVHILLEAEGLQGHAPETVLARLAETMVAALSLRPAQIDVDHVGVRRGRLVHGTFRMRGRFAMRLAPHGEDETGEQRTGLVRVAFNSPFRPFVLASTSVGQEGLDFHPYCHRLVHWNLPSNPVDLEQREGRVHRYKSHAIRLNLAAARGDAVRSDPEPDPWAAMFGAARLAARSDSDLEPYWLCDGKTKVERRVLTLPYSRETTRLAWLKRSLAIYRLAFGQPRQDDFLAWLARIGETLSPDEMAELQIRLRP